MNRRIPLAALIIIHLGIGLSACDPQRLPHILSELEKGRNKKVEGTQDHVLAVLIGNPTMARELLNCALDILLFYSDTTTKRFTNLHYRISCIDEAIKRFDDAPGFRAPLVNAIKDICHSLYFSKYWYDITAALQIKDAMPEETVIAFGLPTNYGPNCPKGAMHNLITYKRWIECKTIDWNSPVYSSGKKLKNLRRALLEQQTLVAEYNEKQESALSYELFSKYPMSDAWNKWLEDYEIPYHVIS